MYDDVLTIETFSDMLLEFSSRHAEGFYWAANMQAYIEDVLDNGYIIWDDGLPFWYTIHNTKFAAMWEIDKRTWSPMISRFVVIGDHDTGMGRVYRSLRDILEEMYQ